MNLSLKYTGSQWRGLHMGVPWSLAVRGRGQRLAAVLLEPGELGLRETGAFIVRTKGGGRPGRGFRETLLIR